MGKRVLVAMSGGVDSAVAAALLVQQGYDVIGVTLRLYTEPDELALRSGRTCCGIEDIGDAKSAAAAIGIPHYTLNMEKEFEANVLDPFIESYKNGRTPNPCVNCNQYVKFDVLFEKAKAFECDYLATGHYASIRENQNQLYELHRASDTEKDQTYVLYMLGQDQLARTLFPLGNLQKHQVREVARSLGMSVADKPDSVDICFVPGGDYRVVLESRGVEMNPGVIELASGQAVGSHTGVAGYTVGQRRGLGIATGQKNFVTDIDPVRNVVVIGNEDDLYKDFARFSQASWVGDPPGMGDQFEARIRYHADPIRGRLTSIGDVNVFSFDTPARGPTPGQILVLYNGSQVLGGGIIEP
ncbi:MAG: tRNA 2-thiouridine(34) synthase MnmA [Dehalococcoidia bacterium]|nr:tRNA 2-thiouridine(34) synthase MnmA [Dehalococcoidia bacterium]